MARLFVAVLPPPEVVSALRRMPRTLTGVRWTDESQWHVTLRFLGSVDESEVPVASAALDAAASSCAGPAVRVAPAVRRFGAALAFEVVGLEDLAAAVAGATAAFGRPPESRAFRGHLTVARVKSRRGGLANLRELRFEAAWRVESIALVESRLGQGPGGTALHETVSVHQLA